MTALGLELVSAYVYRYEKSVSGMMRVCAFVVILDVVFANGNCDSGQRNVQLSTFDGINHREARMQMLKIPTKLNAVGYDVALTKSTQPNDVAPDLG